MNNFEWIRSHEDTSALGHSLCELMDNIEIREEYGCEVCPVRNKCRKGKNGFIKWLEEKHD